MTKAAEGAWIIILMIPVLVALFTITRRHYDHVASELTLRDWTPEPVGAPRRARADRRHPARGGQGAALRAQPVGRRARVYVEIDPARHRGAAGQWPSGARASTLVVLDSPYRSLMEPLLDYIEQMQREDPDGYVTVILPEFVPRRLWQHLLHNQHALLIKGALLFKPNVVVTSVPFHLGRRPTVIPAEGRAKVGAVALEG